MCRRAGTSILLSHRSRRRGSVGQLHGRGVAGGGREARSVVRRVQRKHGDAILSRRGEVESEVLFLSSGSDTGVGDHVAGSDAGETSDLDSGGELLEILLLLLLELKLVTVGRLQIINRLVTIN